jgi:uncharacterized membrane protein YgcG
MTTAADDSAVEDAFEALLAGRPVPEGAAGLAAFTGAVRTSATRPGRPNAALAELLATGLLTDQSSPSTRTARSAGSPPVRRSSRVRIRRRAAMIFPVLIAKFLSAGAVAQAATGAGVVVVAFTGIGAAGALPTPVQDTFATVVETVTPLEAPTSDETAGTVPDEAVVEEVTATEPTAEATMTKPAADATETALTEEKWAEEGPAAGQSFGSWVSEGAHHGWVDGKVVSEWAHKKNVRWDGERAAATPTAAPTEAAESAEAEDRSETENENDDRGGQRGNGSGHGTGRGNSGDSHGGGNGGGNGRD